MHLQVKWFIGTGEHDYNIDVLYDSETDMYFVRDFAEAVGFKSLNNKNNQIL